MAVGNVALFWRPVVYVLGKQHRLFDVGGVIGMAGMGLILVFFTVRNTHRLYMEERIP